MRTVREALTVLLVLTVATGIVYPLAVTGIAKAFFHGQAEGSWIRDDQGRIVGSELIGQPFTSPGYFWSRPSATGPHPYNAGLSSGSNMGPLHPGLAEAVEQRIATLRAAPGAEPTQPVPIDLVTASGSGLDPHISPAAALYQVGRVAHARGATVEEVRAMLGRRLEGRQLGILGEPVVNVLLLNLDLDARFGRPTARASVVDQAIAQ
jgi:K+-transporting ATPase ATPase C chain